MERKDKKLMLIVYYGFHSLPGYQGFQHGPSVVMQQVDLVLPTHTHTFLCQRKYNTLEDVIQVEFTYHMFTSMQGGKLHM